MTDRRPSKPKRIRFYTGTFSCIRGDQKWFVVDFNEEFKVVKCPSCGTPNDVKQAKVKA